jgi:hypothetical protein
MSTRPSITGSSSVRVSTTRREAETTGHKVKIRRSKRNPDFYVVSGGYGRMGVLMPEIEPVETSDFEYAKQIASARVRIGKKNRGEIPFQTYPSVDLSEIDISI